MQSPVFCLPVPEKSSLLEGHFIANLTWKNEQSNPAVKIIGYRVYINGRQYGTDLPESIKSIKIKVGFVLILILLKN
jgi:hypothetical protein